MSIFRKQPATGYTELEPRNTWHVKEIRRPDGTVVRKHYRETVVRRHSDNALRIYLIPEVTA
jgi:hypothetical protein